MKIIAFVLAISLTFPALAKEKLSLREREEAKRKVELTLQNLADERVEPAEEVKLKDGTTAWVHGKYIGSMITIDGEPATEGTHESSDGKIKLVTDEEGRLIAPYQIAESTETKPEEQKAEATESQSEVEKTATTTEIEAVAETQNKSEKT